MPPTESSKPAITFDGFFTATCTNKQAHTLRNPFWRGLEEGTNVEVIKRRVKIIAQGYEWRVCSEQQCTPWRPGYKQNEWCLVYFCEHCDGSRSSAILKKKNCSEDNKGKTAQYQCSRIQRKITVNRTNSSEHTKTRRAVRHIRANKLQPRLPANEIQAGHTKAQDGN